MEAKDLMVGDLARVSKEDICIEKGTIVRVTAVDSEDEIPGLLKGVTHCVSINDEDVSGGVWCAFLDPIPLTAEILKKNNILFEIGPSGLFKVTIKGVDCEVRFNIILHIHELQHALRLCGIEKEIEL